MSGLGLMMAGFHLPGRVEAAFGSDFWRFKETPSGRFLNGIWKGLLGILLLGFSNHFETLDEQGRAHVDWARCRRYLWAVLATTALAYVLGRVLFLAWPWLPSLGWGRLLQWAVNILALVLALKLWKPEWLRVPGRKGLNCPVCGQEQGVFLARLCKNCGVYFNRWDEKLEAIVEMDGKRKRAFIPLNFTGTSLAVIAGLVAGQGLVWLARMLFVV